MTCRATASAESAEAICTAARLLSATERPESGRSSSVADTCTAARVAWRGTSTNAMSAAMNTSPPTIPMTANRRDAFFDRADIHQYVLPPNGRLISDQICKVSARRTVHKKTGASFDAPALVRKTIRDLL